MDFLKRDLLVREPLLVSVLVLITMVCFALTHAYSQAYDRRRSALGLEWFERGKRELRDNRPTAAVEDFRTALFYAPRNRDIGMHLAEALLEASRTEQALNYYLSLWQSTPNNGLINLQLARLYARKGDTVNAEGYFNRAVFGDWPENAAENRQAASLELIHFYLDRGDFGHAESQLILLSGNLPEDPQLHTRVANLYARVGDDQRALNQYREAIQLDPNYVPAIQGAGEATFRVGDYHSAQSYVTRVLRLDEANPSAKNLLVILQSVLLLNPYERGISEAEKAKRALRAFAVASNRLQSCSTSTESSSTSSVAPFLERGRQLKAIANAGFLAQHPEDVETLIDFIASAEKLALSQCGQPTADDSALLAIAQHRETETQ